MTRQTSEPSDPLEDLIDHAISGVLVFLPIPTRYQDVEKGSRSLNACATHTCKPLIAVVGQAVSPAVFDYNALFQHPAGEAPSPQSGHAARRSNFPDSEPPRVSGNPA